MLGVGFLIDNRLFHRADSEAVVWGSTLLVIGVVLFLGTALSSLGLWICHGTC